MGDKYKYNESFRVDQFDRLQAVPAVQPVRFFLAQSHKETLKTEAENVRAE